VRTIRRCRPEDAAACAEIVRGAREHFDEHVAEEVRGAVASGEAAWVAMQGEHHLGFALVSRPLPRTAEIRYLAVVADSRGAGVGGELVEAVCAELVDDGVDLVLLHTLDVSVDYAPYERTRAFWRRHGFVRVAVIDPFPGWRPGNPAALFVRALRITGPKT